MLRGREGATLKRRERDARLAVLGYLEFVELIRSVLHVCIASPDSAMRADWESRGPYHVSTERSGPAVRLLPFLRVHHMHLARVLQVRSCFFFLTTVKPYEDERNRSRALGLGGVRSRLLALHATWLSLDSTLTGVGRRSGVQRSKP